MPDNDYSAEFLLRQATDLYRSLLQEYLALETSLLRKQSREVNGSMQEIRELMVRIEETEKEISLKEQELQDREDLAVLVTERKRLLEELQAKNKTLTDKTNGILAVLGDELQQLGKTRRMTGGYAGGPRQAGSRISRTC
ncbi:MAG: hypothetical protein K9K79_03630 [Desulfohalobiaceae bacterium]|nr:hypothetical protein [Desulfohalobiaceae bacterium]